MPHPVVRGGHAQTLAGFFAPGRLRPYRAVRQFVELDDGDLLVLHDDQPGSWTPGDRVAVLVHGMGGCHNSPYVNRLAARLNEAGVRTFRVDLRGTGAGTELARRPYHAGRSSDLLRAVQTVAGGCPLSPVAVVGFSLGGNILLKMLGEAPKSVPEALDRAAAVCPPIDLVTASRAIRRPVARGYDRYFARLLMQRVEPFRNHHPDVFEQLRRAPRSLLEFDEQCTAPLGGFRGALDYYERASANQFLKGIAVPTLILAAADDPVVPARSFEEADFSRQVVLRITPSGGHLGFVGRRGGDPDRRWMDWRLVEWVCQPGT